MLLDEVYDGEFLFFTYFGEKYEGIVVTITGDEIVINARGYGILSFYRSDMKRVYNVRLDKLRFVVINGVKEGVKSFDGSTFELHGDIPKRVWVDVDIRETCNRLKNDKLSLHQLRLYFYPLTVNNSDDYNIPMVGKLPLDEYSKVDYSFLRMGDVILYEMNDEMLEGTLLVDCKFGDRYLSIYYGGSKFTGGGYDLNNTFIGAITFLRRIDLGKLGFTLNGYRFNKFSILNEFKLRGIDPKGSYYSISEDELVSLELDECVEEDIVIIGDIVRADEMQNFID